MYKDLANSTYKSIFYENLHFLSSDIESLKAIILYNQKLLTDKVGKKLFIDELVDLIKQNKISIAIEQQRRYGEVIMNNYAEINVLYEWLIALNSVKIIEIKEEIPSWNTFKWIAGESRLVALYKKLVPTFVSPDTSLNVFKTVFSGGMLNDHLANIIWVKEGKNHDPNKRSISDFVNILAKQGLIDKSFQGNTRDTLNILNACFSSRRGSMVFNRANLAKESKNSEHCLELEEIITSIFSLPE